MQLVRGVRQQLCLFMTAGVAQVVAVVVVHQVHVVVAQYGSRHRWRACGVLGEGQGEQCDRRL